MRRRRRGDHLPLGIHLLLIVTVAAPGLCVAASFGREDPSVPPAAAPLARTGFQPFSEPIESLEQGIGIAVGPGPNVRVSSAVRVLELRPGRVDLVAGGRRGRAVALPPGVTSLAQLTRAVADPTWLQRSSAGTYRLNVALIVEPRARLLVAGPDVTRLELADRPDVCLAAATSQIDLRDTSVVTTARAASDGSRPRPFVLADRAATVNLVRTRLAGLGWDSSGAYGLSYKGASSGSVLDSTITSGFMGVYGENAPHLVIGRSLVQRSQLAGIQLASGAADAVIDRVRISRSGHFGLVLSDGVRGATMSASEVSGSGQDGVLVVTRSRDVLVRGSVLADNGGAGIVVQRSGPVQVVGNRISHNAVGLNLSGLGSSVAARDNHLHGNGHGAFGLRMKGNDLTGNGGEWGRARLRAIGAAGLAVLMGLEALVLVRFRRTRRRNRVLSSISGLRPAAAAPAPGSAPENGRTSR